MELMASKPGDRRQSYKDAHFDTGSIDLESKEEGRQIGQDSQEGDCFINSVYFIDNYINTEKSLVGAAFIAKVTDYRQSNKGDYIEYEIEVEYYEGAGSKWTVYKRYSDFLELHDRLQGYFQRKS